MKGEVFKTELDKIENCNVRKSTEIILNLLPDYFYKVPASSSGKYHPAYALGEGGLVRHVKVAMRVLEEIFKDDVFGIFDDYTKDLMRMALLLHDGFKRGKIDSGHTVPEHPVIMANFILENKDKLLINEDDAIFVSSMIISHMGPHWNDKHKFLPTPQTDEEKVIHYCDLFASRDFFDVHFDENDQILDSVTERSKHRVLTNEQNKNS